MSDRLTRSRAGDDTHGLAPKGVADDVEVVLVTFAATDQLDDYQQRRRLGLPVLRDPDRSTYDAYGLERGGFRQVWGWSTLRRYTQILKPSGPGSLRDLGPATEDTRQLGGDFVIAPDGTLAWGHWSTGPADRPDIDVVVRAVDDVRNRR